MWVTCISITFKVYTINEYVSSAFLLSIVVFNIICIMYSGLDSLIAQSIDQNKIIFNFVNLFIKQQCVCTHTWYSEQYQVNNETRARLVKSSNRFGYDQVGRHGYGRHGYGYDWKYRLPLAAAAAIANKLNSFLCQLCAQCSFRSNFKFPLVLM